MLKILIFEYILYERCCSLSSNKPFALITEQAGTDPSLTMAVMSGYQCLN
jgi:hypothetical protein